MNLSDFDYELPPERIAQRPLAERDASKMLLLDRKSGQRGMTATFRIFGNSCAATNSSW